jgi:hypothetical protein
VAVQNWSRLEGCHPDLVRLVYDVGQVREIEVAQGARTVAEEQADILSGVSHLQNPADSKHVIVPGVRDLAEAVDITKNPVDWNNHQDFVDLAEFVKARAVALGITITWGGDWPHPFDYDHFQLGGPP